MIYPNYYYKYNAFYNQQMRKKSLVSNTDSQDAKNDSDESNSSAHTKRISPRYNHRVANFNFSNLFSSNLNEPIIEIFGIRLYFDDILILSLLLFLYEEGVKDEMLFICLILLLLS